MDDHEWWQTGVIYQIYPRSFQDSNGDGIGDLAGILERMDYLEWLGVDALWLSPIYPSPMADFGYDVSDYCDIDPIFGNLELFDQLVAEAHRRQMKILLDFVPNHTSDQHPWFLESQASRDNAKSDWYLWIDPKPDGGPPNNWLSSFGGPAWTYSETRQQYYHHHFLSAQPDLNWRNPEVVEAMLSAMRFWLDRGVDGFRLDVIWLIIKDEEFRDNPTNPSFRPNEPPHHRLLATYNTDRPEVHTIIKHMRDLLDSYPHKMMVGEIYLPIERLMTYYGSQGSGVHLPFNFHLINLPWDARQIATCVSHYEASLPPHGWPNWVLGNHDQPRLASRVGQEQARVAAMLLLTLRGTPTMYYGDELGMENVAIPPDRIQDPFEKNVPGIGVGRDPARTPMLWDDSSQAGFSSAEPWLPVSSLRDQINVAKSLDEPESLLNLYQRLLQLRRLEPALSIGSYHPLPADGPIVAYVRKKNDRALLIALNLDGSPARLTLPLAGHYRLLLSTLSNTDDLALDDNYLHLQGNEGIIASLLEC